MAGKGASGYVLPTWAAGLAGPAKPIYTPTTGAVTGQGDPTMGLLDTPEETEEEDSNNDGDSGTYIQFISGPNHRDWKESWSDDAKQVISEAYETASPNGSSGTVNSYANGEWDDRHHFYAEVTLRLHEALENGDFQPMLEFIVGNPRSEEMQEVYADALEEYLSGEPEVAEKLLERVNVSEEAAPADD